MVVHIGLMRNTDTNMPKLKKWEAVVRTQRTYDFNNDIFVVQF